MVIKERNPILCIVLGIVTCGIYAWYWNFMMGKEVMSMTSTPDSILEPILMVFFPFIGYYLVEKKFTEACAAKGIEHKDNAVLYLVLCLILPVVSFYMLQTELNKFATPSAQ